MADNDKLYFTLGVRDEITNQVKDILKQVNILSDACDSISQKGMSLSGLKIGDTKSANRDLHETQNILNQITEAIFKLSNTRLKVLDVGQDVSKIDEFLIKLRELRSEVVDISAQKDVSIKMSADTSIVDNLESRITNLIPTLKEVGNALNEAMKIQSKNPNESVQKTIDQLSKEYESLENTINALYTSYLQFKSAGEIDVTKQLGLEHLEESFGSAAMAAQKHAKRQRELSEAFGAYFEEIERKEKEEAEARKRDAEALDEQNKKLKENETLKRSLDKLIKDTKSQRDIADLRGQNAEFDALKNKLSEIEILQGKVIEERNKILSGAITTPTYTKDKIEEELDDIQRKYNEDLARGKQLEKEDADAKRQKAEAAKQAAQAVREQAKANQGLVDAYKKVVSSGKNANSVTEQLNRQIGSYFSLLGMERLVRNIIQIGGEFEVQHIALQSILGDIQQANSMFEQMKELAVVSPFNFRQLAGYSKQIAAFGIPYEEMYDTTKRLADMAAGLGVDMSRLILAYGQVRSAAVLRGQELRQFTEAGIPMVRALAEEFTKLNGRAVSTAEVFELISKRAVPFEMVKKVMWDMTSEGGRFFDMQFTLSDTLAGKWSNLRDAWEIMLSEIARGESVSGRFFKSLVSLTTTLIENLHTALPIITAIGTSIGAAKLNNYFRGFGNLGFNSIDQNIEKAQKLRAIELARMKINGEISRSKYTELMRMNMNKGNYYQVLAMEGKLNVLQVQRAYQQGHINKQQLAYLVQMRAITNEQRKQVILGNISNSTFSRLQNSAKGLFNSLNSYLGKSGWIMVALDVAVTAFLAIKGHIDEIKRKNEELVKSFSNHAKELKDSLGGMTTVPGSDEEYKNAIEGMKELLKQHSSNYDAVMLEVNAVDDLSKKYDILKNALQGANDVYTKAELTTPDFGNETRSSFEDVRDWARELSKQKGAGRFEFSFDWDEMKFRKNEDIFLDRVKQLAEKIKKEIPNVGKDAFSNNLFRKLRDGLEEEIGVGSREKLFINVKLNELLNIQDADALTDTITEKFSTAISTTEKTIANKIKYGQTLTDAEKDKVKELVNNAIEDTRKLYPEFSSTLQQLLNDSNFYARIQLKFAESGDANQLQKQIYGNFGNMPIAESTKVMATQWGLSGSWYDAKNKAKQDIDKRYNELVAIEEAREKGKAKAEDVTKKREEYEEATNAALWGLGYDYKGEKKKANKEPKSSKTDTVLNQWKEEWNELKAFYSEFKKWAKKVGDDAALKKLYESGLWGQLFDKKGNPIYDMKNWDKAIDEYIKKNGVKGGTTARDKHLFEVGKAKVDFDYDINEKELERAASEMQEYLSRQTEKWNLYKSLLEKTGSEDFAKLAFNDGKVWTEVSQGFADKLKDAVEKAGKSLPADVWDFTDAQAKEHFEGVQNGYEIWKKVVELIRGEYKDGLNEIAAATGELLTVEDKILKAEQELAELRSKYGYNSAPAIKKENEIKSLQAEQFEKSEPYTRFFSGLYTMTLNEAESAGEAIKQNLVKQLADGKINADKYLKSIKNIDAQLDKLRNKKLNVQIFNGDFSAKYREKVEIDEDKLSFASTKLERAEENLQKVRLEHAYASTDAERSAALGAIKNAAMEKQKAEMEVDTANKNLKNSQKQYQNAQKFQAAVAAIAYAISAMVSALNDARQAAAAYGEDLDANMNSFGQHYVGILEGLNQGLSKLQQGDFAGAISSTVFGSIANIAQKHDASLQQDIKESQETAKMYQNMQTMLEKKLDNILGGIYNLKTTEDDRNKLYDYLGEINPEKTKKLFSGNMTESEVQDYGYELFIKKYWTYTPKRSKDTESAVRKAIESGTYYDTAFANMLIQRDELQRQLADEEDMKNKDEGKILDMKEELAEAEEDIKNFAQDMAKVLYDIDVKSWASELGDALFEAWQKGEDGAEAFRKKSKEIIRDLAKNIAVQKLVEDAMEPVLSIITEQMKEKKGKLDSESVEAIAAQMELVGNTLPDAFNALMDGINEGVKRSGLGDLKEDDSSSSASNTISSAITEQSANMLIALAETMRADLSVERSDVAAIRMSVEAMAGRGNFLTEAQEQNLRLIAENTRRNADVAADIFELLRNATLDKTRGLYMR